MQNSCKDRLAVAVRLCCALLHFPQYQPRGRASQSNLFSVMWDKKPKLRLTQSAAAQLY